MLIRDAVQRLVHSFSVPEEEIESLYQSQKVGPKRSTFLNIVFFFLGISLLIIGVYKTYLLTSQPDPHGAVLKRFKETSKEKNKSDK